VSAKYTGRFAPSPTGPLHFGSLVAAAGSYLDARAAGGEWLVRMEDIDKPREMSGAADDILGTLDSYGFEWDGEVEYQSWRIGPYREALERLRREGWVYPCACSRTEIAKAANGSGAPYPGTCRAGLPAGRGARAWRVRSDGVEIRYRDRVHGELEENLAATAGDFVLLRADGIFAYQLAVVVDDAAQGITDVVRGADLLESTARQVHLQRLIGFEHPRYLHLPVAWNEAGEKLSKQTRARPIAPDNAAAELVQALEFLGQAPPSELGRAPLSELWRWAIANWQPERIPSEPSPSR
jgi:glutamyl-Q tRNA(Asp) synthetase